MFEFLGKLNPGLLTSFGQNSGFVALDIGSSSIKMVEAAVEKSGYRLLNLGILPLPANAIQNNMVVDHVAVADAIRRLVQQSGVKATRVICAVPGRAVIMKKVQMPRQEDSELEANVEFEANNVIPENLENVNLDYQVLNFVDGGNKMEVLLVAVKKDLVNSYAEVIAEAGLEPAVMDVDYFALENMYEANYAREKDGGVVGLIHLGACYTSMTLLHNGLSTFTGDLPIGGEEFTDGLKRELNISPSAAENFKLTGAVENKKGLELQATLRPMVENFADEIRRTISLYGAVPSEEGDGLRMILLSGGSAKLSGLRELLEQKMTVPVRLTEPFRGFTLSKNIDRNYLLQLAPLFAIGAGLAIRRPGDK
jgi:type IV pilus assembly protein PilM